MCGDQDPIGDLNIDINNENIQTLLLRDLTKKYAQYLHFLDFAAVCTLFFHMRLLDEKRSLELVDFDKIFFQLS